MAGIQYQVPHVNSLGKGSVLFDRFLAGAPTGVLIHLGNCMKFDIEPKDQKAELYQSLYSSPTKIAEAVKKRDIEISIEGTDFSSDHAALFAITSAKSSLVVTGGAVSAETLITVAQAANCKGRYFQTSIPNLASVTDLKQGVSTLVAGTDYIVLDLAHGIIYIPLTSSIVSGTLVSIDYVTTAANFDQINGHTVNFVEGRILFIPQPADGPSIMANVWRVNLTQSGKIGLIADEYGNWTLNGACLDDTANHPTAPFYQLTYL